ncbi:MAG: GntR family transcriptional regulator [Oscillospiraceae bacterium]|nr:GntR family transcriptional regulator [Oscillospiraceae bacterium]
MDAWDRFDAAFSDSSPIYSQIITLFSRSLARGEISPGERIPSIRDMSLHLKVNANTMQRVYREMERSGLISSRRGTGYYFTEDEDMAKKVGDEMARVAVNGFLEEMRALGFSDERIMSELKIRLEGEKNDGASDDKRA